MKHKALLIICAFGSVALAIAISAADGFSPASLSPARLYAGSTPCDAYIKSVLDISSEAEFIKWEIRLTEIKKDQFQMEGKAVYGMSQPGTNGFKGGGTTISFSGTCSPMADNSKMYQLQSSTLKAPLKLRRLDDRLFHMLNNEEKLLVGNGGYSYTLNQVE